MTLFTAPTKVMYSKTLYSRCEEVVGVDRGTQRILIILYQTTHLDHHNNNLKRIKPMKTYIIVKENFNHSLTDATIRITPKNIVSMINRDSSLFKKIEEFFEIATPWYVERHIDFFGHELNTCKIAIHCRADAEYFFKSTGTKEKVFESIDGLSYSEYGDLSVYSAIFDDRE